MTAQPDAGGHFGPYGGRYVPEVLMAPLEELETAYLAARAGSGVPGRAGDCCATTPGGPRRSISRGGSRSNWAGRGI